jgi:2'-5' RNA ligase
VIPAKAHPLPGSFKPHLTLARIKLLKNKKAFFQAVEMYRDTFMQTTKINKIIFYRSVLKPEGAEYRELGSFSFL